MFPWESSGNLRRDGDMRISSRIFSRETPGVDVCMVFNVLTISEFQADLGTFGGVTIASVYATGHSSFTFQPSPCRIRCLRIFVRSHPM